MPCAAAPSTSWARSPTITTRSGSGLKLLQRVGQHIGLGWTATPSTLAPAITSKWPVEAEVLEDPPRRRLGLRGGHRQPHAGGAQVGEQLRDAVEQAVHRPAAAGVVGPVGGDRRVGEVAEPHALQRVVHRRPDDPAGQVAVGNLGAHVAERVAEAGHDAVGGVGQGAVEIEDHQLRAGVGGRACHVPIVPDGTPVPPMPAGPARALLFLTWWRCRDERATRRGHRRARRRLPARAGARLGLGRTGVRRSRTRPSSPSRSPSTPPPRSSRRCGQRGLLLAHHPLLLRGVDTVAADTAQGGADPPADPLRCGAVHRPHQRRRGQPGSVRRAGRGAGADGRRSARPGRRRPGHRQVGDLRAAGARRGGALGGVRRRCRAHRRLLALQLERHRHRAVPAAGRRVAGDRHASDPSNASPRTASR